MGLLVLGTVIGNTFAAIPGLSGTLAVALILPFTFYLPTIPAMALLLGAYKGAMFGGAVTAVAFGVPGDSPAAATVLDGYPLCKKGFPNKALDAALYGSIFGNFFADLLVIFTVIPISLFALMFGPRELTALMILAMSSLVLLFGGSVKHGILGAVLGAFIATIGSDPLTAIPRLTFGLRPLMDGVPLVPFVSGLFAFSELLIQFGQGVYESHSKKVAVNMLRKRSPDDKTSFRELLSCWREALTACVIGSILGALPGPGATMAAFSSYGMAGRMEKNKGKMGTGHVAGVVAAETADSATVGPTLIPLLTFGVPGSTIAALFGAALMLQGITPGPGLFTDHMDLIAAIFVLTILGTALNLIVGKLIIIPVFSRLAMIEKRALVAALLPMMAIGIYAINLKGYDVLIMFLAGMLGLLLRRIRIPLAPVAVAVIVVPILELQFKRAATLAMGDWMYYVGSPLSLILYGVLLVLAIYAWKTR
jgi:putative tricarboxylic transport membrane protein